MRYVALLICALLLAAAFWLGQPWLWLRAPLLNMDRLIFAIPGLALYSFVGLVGFFIWSLKYVIPSSIIPLSYAVIVPLSLAEHRERQSSQMYPRRSWIVAIVAAMIAATAVGVAIWAVLSR